MKIIDRYLIKQFIQSILFGLLAFTLIFVVIDLMENLDDFIDMNVPNEVIIQYYIVFMPEIIRLMMPVAVLFASLFTVGKMSNLNELTAIKAAGVSLYRFMLPVIIVTLMVCAFSVYFGGYIVPKANEQKLSFEMKYLNRGYSFAGSNIFFQDSPTKIVSISYFDEPNLMAMRVGIQQFDPKDLTRMVNRLDAQRLKFDTLKNKWVAMNGTERTFSEYSETLSQFTEKELTGVYFRPGDLSSKQMKPEEMHLGELRELIENQKRAGTDPSRTEIEYHSRFAFAITPFVVVLFGLPFSANKRKGGLAIQVGINILITFIYLVLMKISQAFGKNGAMDPFLTAWLVNFLFFFASVINLARFRQ